jgi:hypothetical protein
MGISFSTIIVSFIIVVLIAGMISVGVATWPSTTVPPMTSEAFYLIVGNGEQTFETSFPTEYPFVRSGNQVSVTYAFKISAITPATPSLPVLIALPSNATNLSSVLTVSSKALPVGQTSLHVVQYGTNTVALQYQPSGHYVIGSDLTVDWTFIYQVIYTIA